MTRIPMTPAGFARLSAELKELKEHTRLKIVRDIEEARAQGDISENSEYEDAKHRQSLCEGRIMELEGKLGAAGQAQRLFRTHPRQRRAAAGSRQ